MESPPVAFEFKRKSPKVSNFAIILCGSDRSIVVVGQHVNNIEYVIKCIEVHKKCSE